MNIKILITAAFSILIAGCVVTGSNTAPTVSASTMAAPVAVEPEWVPMTEGSEIYFDKNYKYHPSYMKLSNGMLLSGNKWNDHIKKYVESFPPTKRTIIIDGITRHVTNYDKVENFIRFEPVRHIDGPYEKSSYVAIIGSLSPGETKILAKFRYYGRSWIFAKSFKVVTDGISFQSPAIKFNRDTNVGNVTEVAYLDLSDKENLTLIERIVFSKETIIRFQGEQYYSDLIVTDRMREDMGAILKLAEITRVK